MEQEEALHLHVQAFVNLERFHYLALQLALTALQAILGQPRVYQQLHVAVK